MSSSNPIDTAVDNREQKRFELTVTGPDGNPHTAIADYILSPPGIVFTHTEVPEILEGRGVGSKLVRAALDSARERGLVVTPICPFFAAYIQKHPEYHDLVEPNFRAQLGIR